MHFSYLNTILGCWTLLRQNALQTLLLAHRKTLRFLSIECYCSTAPIQLYTFDYIRFYYYKQLAVNHQVNVIASNLLSDQTTIYRNVTSNWRAHIRK